MGECGSHRPLYGNHNGLLVVCGDKPFVRYGTDGAIHGSLVVGYQRANASHVQWLHEMDSGVQSLYRGGEMQWIANVTPTTALRWTTAPLAESGTAGMSVQIDIVGRPETGDQILWMFGGAYALPAGSRPLGWTLDCAVNPANLHVGFDPSHADGNRVAVDSSANSFTVSSGNVGVRGCATASGAIQSQSTYVTNAHDNSPTSPSPTTTLVPPTTDGAVQRFAMWPRCCTTV